ncbi:MinD/ParA family protein [Arthrobacter sp. H5]|uniref:MinD/ParA family ATP-binding protein n=1 Tax=Arthrobacter sp. H5 TaxID=1267973 RepID=UPI0004B9C2EF|nr:MinD/ParA family protein [Arthrobacter sp. H5]
MATDREPAEDSSGTLQNLDGASQSPEARQTGEPDNRQTPEVTPEVTPVETLEQDRAPSGPVPLVTVDSVAGSDDAAALPGLGGPLLQPPAPEHLPTVGGEPVESTNDDGVSPGPLAPTVGTARQNDTGLPTDDTPAQNDTPGDRSARRDRDNGPEPASSLTADRLLAGQQRPPVDGWRRLLYKATFGYVNLGDSDAVRIRRALEHRIAVRLGERTRYVPVLSRKGGVGKTTVTTLLGMALADIREDRIIAMDANPDRGTLSDRSPGKADSTARQLVQNRFMVDSFAQLSSYVTRDGSRLHVLASDTDPAVAQAFDDADYRAVTDILGRYYSIVLTDSGTGMVHSVMKGTLEKADSVVLVSGGSVDEARLASETLSWLEAHGRHDLVAKAIVVVNLSSGNRTEVNVTEIEDHFRSRVGTVVRIPYDRHLAEGSRVDLAKLQPRTRDAVVELAAHVVDHLHS